MLAIPLPRTLKKTPKQTNKTNHKKKQPTKKKSTKPLLPSNLLYIKPERKHIPALHFQLILHKLYQAYMCKHKCNLVCYKVFYQVIYLALISTLETLVSYITSLPTGPKQLPRVNTTLCLMKSGTYSLS